MYSYTLVFIFISLIDAETWDRHLILDPDEKYHVWWSASGDNITFEVQVETKGWVGFGISPNGEMTGSDVVIGWVVNNGTFEFQDRYAEGRLLPTIDDDQDWELLLGYENDTHTILRFRRSLFICKDQDLDINLDEEINLIYAYNSNDPQSAATISYHGYSTRGSKSIYLGSKRVKRNKQEENYSWEMRKPSVFRSSKYPKVRTYQKRDVCSPHTATENEETTAFHPKTQERETPGIQSEPTIKAQPSKRRRIPQTLPYELIEQAIRELG